MGSLRGWPAVGVLVAAAAACLIVAVLYYVGALQVFTSSGTGTHAKHAALFAGLALVCLIAASFLRPRASLA